MLMAEAAEDRDSFNRIWQWTKANLFVRDDGLAAWRWDPTSDAADHGSQQRKPMATCSSHGR